MTKHSVGSRQVGPDVRETEPFVHEREVRKTERLHLERTDHRMSSIASAHSTHQGTVGLCVALAVALLSGCSGEATKAPGRVVTVTVTVTAEPTEADSVTPPPTTTTSAAGVARSDVVGRKFDLGTIVRIEDDGGVPVIIFDRWTAAGVPDSTLATQGLPMDVHSDARFQNLNTKITFRIPVVQGAIFTYRHCVAIDQHAAQKASTLQEFAGLQGSEKVMLLTLDPQGQVFSAQNDPAC